MRQCLWGGFQLALLQRPLSASSCMGLLGWPSAPSRMWSTDCGIKG